MSAAQTKAIEAVVEQRPLAKMQEKLDKDAVEAEAASEKGNANKLNVLTSEPNDAEDGAHGDGGGPEARPKSRMKHQMLLHNNDYELMRIEAVSPLCALFVMDILITAVKILTEVHRRFYEGHANQQSTVNTGLGQKSSNTLDVRVRIARCCQPSTTLILNRRLCKQSKSRYSGICISHSPMSSP